MRSVDPNLPPSYETEPEKKPARAEAPSRVQEIAPEDEVVLAWRVWLARQRPKQAAIGIAVILLVMAWAVYVFSMDRNGAWRQLNVIPALLFGVIMAGAMSELLFPVSYKLTRRGAYRRNFLSATQIEWQVVRKCYLAPDGVKLSPLRRQTRLESFRGIFLRFGNDNRDEVVRIVTELRDAAQPATDRR